ncbi:MAG: low molecular weight protein arginine phosphatase [Firmicutes bacterium]|nr:low molecular weight protein arginine phosphatase [Bacillota bacterium]
MAEAIFRQLAAKQADHDWLISSAGIHAAAGASATVEALEVLKGLGLELSGHSARQLTEEILRDVDLILTMTVSHKRSIKGEFPLVADKVFTVKEYAGKVDGLDIGDPFGAGLEAYHLTAAELQENLTLVWKRLMAETERDG